MILIAHAKKLRETLQFLEKAARQMLKRFSQTFQFRAGGAEEEIVGNNAKS